MPKDKIHILSTRTLDEMAIAKAADVNIEVDSIPFINVQPIYSDELKNQLQELADQLLFVVFTSSNAVTSVIEQISKAPNWKIGCTGGKTKEYIINAFSENSVVASAKNASLLAERIIALNGVSNITFFCGDQRLNDLPEKLSSHAIQTDEVVVYTSVQTPVFVEKNYGSILFFSPSAVHSFFSVNTIATNVILFSIGQSTTAVIQTYCTNKIITSNWPGTESLMERVVDFYNINFYAD